MSRTYKGDGYRIVYPNRLAYSGMPALVSIADATAYDGVGITIKVGEEYYSEARTLYGGSATFDISRYLQMAFLNKELAPQYGGEPIKESALGQEVSAVVQLSNASGESLTALSFDTLALFGYIAYGQVNGGARHRKLWANFPQTFDFFINNSSEIYVEFEDNYQDYNTVAWGDYKQASVEVAIPGTAKSAELYADGVIYLNGATEVQGHTVYRLSVDRSKSGVYLRWIDHLGQWCYHLLRCTGNNYTTKELQTWAIGELRDGIEPTNGVLQSGDFLHQQLSRQQTISLGAKLVDADTFDYLLSLTNSPRVEMLLNAEDYQTKNAQPIWERVNIVAGSYARTGAPLQDFVVSIAKTANKTQML